MATLVELIKVNGWPTALLVIFGVVVWRLAKWLQPRIDRVIDVHLATVESVSKCQEDINATLSETKNLVAAAMKPNEDIHRKIDRTLEHAEHIRGRVDRKWPDGLA